MYIEAIGNENYNAVQVSAYRDRKNGETVYWVSVTPCKREGCFVQTLALDGYKCTLIRAARASKKAEANALLEAMRIVPFMVEDVCKDKGMTVDEYDLDAIVFKAL